MLGLDDYLGHDLEPTTFLESSAYPATSDKQDPLSSPKTSVLLQDFILLTDFISIPELVTLL